MAKKYVFDPYDETLPSLFLTEKTRILAKISNALQIEHVGSTAVPGLGGKGIIDIAILVKEADMTSVSDSLQHLGYEFRPSYSTPNRLYFVAFLPDIAKGTRRYHIHLTHPGSTIWEELVGLRDYLIRHPEAKKAYAAIKAQAIQNNQESEEYRQAKDPFLKKILQKIAHAKLSKDIHKKFST